MNISIYDKIRACYLAYINEKNDIKKMIYFDLLKKYFIEEKEIRDGKKLLSAKEKINRNC